RDVQVRLGNPRDARGMTAERVDFLSQPASDPVRQQDRDERPDRGYRAGSFATVPRNNRRRSRSSAIWVDCHFTADRSPANWNRRASTSPETATPMKTVPTGFPGVPPSGPAMPVMARPTGLPLRAQMPRAMASAQGALTAP